MSRRPKGYWTKEKCQEESLKYNNIKDFRKNNKSCYSTCVKNEWLDDIKKNKDGTRNKKGYWSKDKCREEALKYNSRSDFCNNNQHAYKISLDNDWLDYICSHMETFSQPKGYWTYEKCKNEALKYKTRKQFKKKCSTAFSTSYTNFWMDDVCSHMTRVRKPWTKEECKEEAIKYKIRNDYKNGSSSYNAALKNKWIDEICYHMKKYEKQNRCIYAYEFDDKCVYVGLTKNIKTRKHQHKKNRFSL